MTRPIYCDCYCPICTGPDAGFVEHCAACNRATDEQIAQHMKNLDKTFRKIEAERHNQ